MIIFLNAHCSYGHGLKKWKRIESYLLPLIEHSSPEAIQSPEWLSVRISRLMKSGETLFVAAGGDGTVNLLLNAILSSNENTDDVCLGAIGLGSSNDFHKPMDKRKMIKGVPVKINPQQAFCRDVICVKYLDAAYHKCTRYCLNNASIGITAEANDLFNRQPALIRNLRKLSVNSAITAAALRTIFQYRNLPCTLSNNGSKSERLRITNLGIVKNPHFAGSLSYEPVVQPDDGWLGVHLLENMSRTQSLMALARLSRGKFKGYPNTKTWTEKHLVVESEHLFSVELDGEIVKTRSADFSVMPKALRCCE